MEIIEAYKKFWLNYATFDGRTRRSDYWFAFLANFLISAAISLISGMFILTPIKYLLSSISSLYWLAILIPQIAIAVRRLHDTGKSGAYLLFIFIPLVGIILLLVWLATDSQPGANMYGVNPKGIDTNFEYQTQNNYQNSQQNQYNQQNSQNTQQSQPKFCTKCGNPLKQDENFCTNCGSKVK